MDISTAYAIPLILIIGGVVYIGGNVAKATIPERVTNSAWWARILPVQPVFWGCVYAFILMSFIDTIAGLDYVWPVALAVGVWSGAMGQSAYAIVRQTIIGHDPRITGAPDRRALFHFPDKED
jgi:hypothetical protein